MLIGNYSVLSKSPGRYIGGGAIGLGMNRGDFNNSSMARGVFTNSGWQPKSGIPDGYRPPYVWVLPIKEGALSTRNSTTGSGTISNADAWAVRLAEAMLTGTGELTAVGGLIVQALAAISGSGTISAANLQAFLAAVASLTGSGGITAGTLTGIGELLADILGDGTLDASVLSALGELSADLTVTGTGLSTANVGEAVWSAIAASNNAPGTMGEKLNDAGSASNPWTEVIESGLSAAEILRIIAAALAGEVSGAGSGTETFVGLDGATDRIVSTVDVDGNRTNVVVDGT